MKKFENRSIFDEVIIVLKCANFWGHNVHSSKCQTRTYHKSNQIETENALRTRRKVNDQRAGRLILPARNQ